MKQEGRKPMRKRLVPLAKMGSRTDKEKDMAYIRRQHPDLGYLVRDSDSRAIAKVRSVLKASARRGFGSFGIADSLRAGMATGSITRDSLRPIAAQFEATVKGGHDPAPLAGTLKKGFLSQCIPAEYAETAAESLRNVYEATAKNGHDLSRLAGGFDHVFEKKVFEYKELGPLLPAFEALAKAGKEPSKLADSLLNGVQNDEFNTRFLASIGPHIEAAARYARDPSDLQFLVRDLRSDFGSYHVDSKDQPLFVPHIEAAARHGKNPRPILRALMTNMADKMLNSDDIALLVPHVEAAAKAGKDPSELVSHLARGLGSKAITRDSLPAYADLLNTAGSKWDHGELIANAIEAHKIGVPGDRIPDYQKQLMGRGHFPNAGLIKELHEAKMKERK